MHQRALFFSLALLGFAAFAVYWQNIRLRPEDRPAFEKLVQESKELHKKHALEKEPARQHRLGVQKEIWSQDETYHLQIESEESDLTFALKGDRIEALEELKNVRCTLENNCTLIADTGKFQPEKLTLEGNVRLVAAKLEGKESFALAEKVVYDPIEKTLLFSSTKKVLFWQEGLSLSAQEVLIKKDQTVEGKGDVHFCFDLEEKNSIEQLFKQYL
jgi:hypothetical protein